jgi:hypothetical protein
MSCTNGYGAALIILDDITGLNINDQVILMDGTEVIIVGITSRLNTIIIGPVPDIPALTSYCLPKRSTSHRGGSRGKGGKTRYPNCRSIKK